MGMSSAVSSSRRSTTNPAIAHHFGGDDCWLEGELSWSEELGER